MRRTLTIHAWTWRHLHWCTSRKIWRSWKSWIRSLHLWRSQILSLSWNNRWLLSHRHHILVLLRNDFSRSKHPWCWNWGHQPRSGSFNWSWRVLPCHRNHVLLVFRNWRLKILILLLSGVLPGLLIGDNSSRHIIIWLNLGSLGKRRR